MDSPYENYSQGSTLPYLQHHQGYYLLDYQVQDLERAHQD
jgi:hypothetical protein